MLYLFCRFYFPTVKESVFKHSVLMLAGVGLLEAAAARDWAEDRIISTTAREGYMVITRTAVNPQSLQMDRPRLCRNTINDTHRCDRHEGQRPTGHTLRCELAAHPAGRAGCSRSPCQLDTPRWQRVGVTTVPRKTE